MSADKNMEQSQPEQDKTPLKVALLGCGTVGSQVARLILEANEDLAARIRRPIELVGVAVQNEAGLCYPVKASLVTNDALALVSRDDLDVVIELIGGIEPARTLILTAIEHGASVVTANKALLAAHGDALYSAAEDADVDLYYEAAVAGAIPIIRPLRESLVGDEITAVMGIVNGTTNYILDKMTTEGSDFQSALKQAQDLGYAEADPTADIEGMDAAAKAAILAGLAFHTRVPGDQVYCEGITGVEPGDIAFASEMGYVIKLLAIAQLLADNRISARVHPAMVPAEHPLASVGGAFNAIFVESKEAGRLMFMGPGAGGAPTASSVVGDLVTVARNRVRGVTGPAHSIYADRSLAPMGETRARYFVRFNVLDQPGVLASAAAVFARHGVSLRTVQQTTSDGPDGQTASLGVMTHDAQESAIQSCVEELSSASFVHSKVHLMRVLGA